MAANAPIKVKLAALVFSVLGFLYNLSLGGNLLARRNAALCKGFLVLLKFDQDIPWHYRGLPSKQHIMDKNSDRFNTKLCRAQFA